MRRTLTALVLGVSHLLASGGNGYTQDFDAGAEAARKGDFATAFREWRPLAEQGNVTAQFNLGLMYSNGQGVTQNYREAAKWFHKSAEQGNARAQYQLGVMYGNGRGVPQDDREAVKWYRKGAEQGYAEAQGGLGASYAAGKGILASSLNRVGAGSLCGAVRRRPDLVGRAGTSSPEPVAVSASTSASR